MRERMTLGVATRARPANVLEEFVGHGRNLLRRDRWVRRRNRKQTKLRSTGLGEKRKGRTSPRHVVGGVAWERLPEIEDTDAVQIHLYLFQHARSSRRVVWGHDHTSFFSHWSLRIHALGAWALRDDDKICEPAVPRLASVDRPVDVGQRNAKGFVDRQVQSTGPRHVGEAHGVA